ncbi:MAG: nucleoside-diphosphate kinase [Saprospiraceae bacterium]
MKYIKADHFMMNWCNLCRQDSIVAAILEKDNAVEDFRKLIGATDPSKAEPGTIRALYAKSIGENAVHGADSDENALREGSFHFAETEMF